MFAFNAGLHWKCTPTALANDKKTTTTTTALGSTERTRISCVLLTTWNCWSVKRQANSTYTLSMSVLSKSTQMTFVSLQYPKDTKLRYYFNGCKARNISLPKLLVWVIFPRLTFEYLGKYVKPSFYLFFSRLLVSRGRGWTRGSQSKHLHDNVNFAGRWSVTFQKYFGCLWPPRSCSMKLGKQQRITSFFWKLHKRN